MSEQHRSYFNTIARRWRNEPASQAFVDNLRRFNIQPNDVILDIGCGAGCATQQVLELEPAAQVIGIDVSEKMLGAARKNVGHAGARFVCCDAGVLSLADSSIQKIICYSTFPHLRNHNLALKEFYRVLQPRGRVLIFHNCCSRRLNSYHAKINDIVAFDKLPKAELLANAFHENGFVNVNVVEQPHQYYISASKGELS